MSGPPFNSLSEWLNWQESLHPAEIELGLERIRHVAQRLAVLKPEALVISVAGTNGKGSTVSMLAAAYADAGYQVGTYTSPHLLRYNERVCINGAPVSDEALCEAFNAVETARGSTSLTYFEYGTLAALWLLQQQALDVLLLEVGLGGRLDAVNIMDADLAIITNIGLDHTDWLGDSREAIAGEKAGICRPGVPVVYNDQAPVDSIPGHAFTLGSPLSILGRDYQLTEAVFSSGDISLQLPEELPPVQQLNACGVLQALILLSGRLPLDMTKAVAALAKAQPPGRQQQRKLMMDNGKVECIFDVSHNLEAVEALKDHLAKQPASGKTHLLFAALADKPIEGISACMNEVADRWHLAALDVPRGCTVEDLVERVRAAQTAVVQHDSIAAAWQAVKAEARAGDRVVVFGSFYTVEAVTKLLDED